MTLRIARRSILGALAAYAVAPAPVLAQDAPVIAAASNLQFVLAELAAQFTAKTGANLRLSFGSTGNLSRQIRQGAPFELFLSADDATPLALHSDGFTPDTGTVFALGRLVLSAPKGSIVTPDAGLDGLRPLLASGKIRRFAIANPDHAPFGIAARQALTHAGLWSDIQPYLVTGENVAQAAQFTLSGNADAGLIALSLALAPELAGRGTHALVPTQAHDPLHHRMVLLNGAGPTATAFFAYLTTPDAQTILNRNGFDAAPSG